jgi:hypothetical protein
VSRGAQVVSCPAGGPARLSAKACRAAFTDYQQVASLLRAGYCDRPVGRQVTPQMVCCAYPTVTQRLSTGPAHACAGGAGQRQASSSWFCISTQQPCSLLCKAGRLFVSGCVLCTTSCCCTAAQVLGGSLVLVVSGVCL